MSGAAVSLETQQDELIKSWIIQYQLWRWKSWHQTKPLRNTMEFLV